MRLADLHYTELRQCLDQEIEEDCHPHAFLSKRLASARDILDP